MASGTKYNTKQELLNAIGAQVFTNNSFQTSSDDIQKNDKDIVESLWDKADQGKNYIATTHADLLTEINDGTLVPGTWYGFEFQTIHIVLVIGDLNTNLANIPTETLIVQATSNNTLSKFALSKERPQDLIYYDVTPVDYVGQANLGTITRRYDTERDIDTPFDFMGFYVARGNYDFSGYAQNVASANYTGDAKDLVIPTAASTTQVHYFYFDATNSTSPYVYSSKPICNTDTYDGLAYIGFRRARDINLFDIPVTELTAIQAVNPNTNFSVHVGAYNDSNYSYCDVYITNCVNIQIGSNIQSISIKNSVDIIVSNEVRGFIATECRNCAVGYESQNVLLNACFEVNIEDRVVDSWFNLCQSLRTGRRVTNVYAAESLNGIIESFCEDLILDNSIDFELKTQCKNINLGLGIANYFGGFCNNITLLGGNYNTFEQFCTTINLNNYTSNGLTSYTAYSPISYSHFGKGCKNITFYDPNADGGLFYVTHVNFGDGGENISINNRIEHVDFCRSTRNVTIDLTDGLAYCSFIVPTTSGQLTDAAPALGPGLIIDHPSFNLVLSGNAETVAVDIPAIKANRDDMGDASNNLSVTNVSTYGKAFRWNTQARAVTVGIQY